MDLFEPIAGPVGEVSANVLGRILGKTLDLEQRKAQRIGELVIAFVILGAAAIVTMVLS